MSDTVASDKPFGKGPRGSLIIGKRLVFGSEAGAQVTVDSTQPQDNAIEASHNVSAWATGNITFSELTAIGATGAGDSRAKKLYGAWIQANGNATSMSTIVGARIVSRVNPATIIAGLTLTELTGVDVQVTVGKRGYTMEQLAGQIIKIDADGYFVKSYGLKIDTDHLTQQNTKTLTSAVQIETKAGNVFTSGVDTSNADLTNLFTTKSDGTVSGVSAQIISTHMITGWLQVKVGTLTRYIHLHNEKPA